MTYTEGDPSATGVPADWIAAAQGFLADVAGSDHGLANGSAECTVCPLCRAIAALRAADPVVVATVTSALVEAATATVDILRDAGERLLATAGSMATERAAQPAGDPVDVFGEVDDEPDDEPAASGS